MLLSKLLRTATLTGRNSQDVVAEFLEANKGSVPQVPMQQQAASRKGMLGSDPVATAASGQGLVDVDGRLGSRSLAEEGEAEQPQFQAAEVRHLSSLNAMSQEREVDLPLERAQTILRWVGRLAITPGDRCVCAADVSSPNQSRRLVAA